MSSLELYFGHGEYEKPEIGSIWKRKETKVTHSNLFWFTLKEDGSLVTANRMVDIEFQTQMFLFLGEYIKDDEETRYSSERFFWKFLDVKNKVVNFLGRYPDSFRSEFVCVSKVDNSSENP